jgi:pilus assembly protein CpaB
MFKRRGVILVIVSLGLGILAAMAANNWLQGRMVTTVQADVSTVAVVAAAMQIPYGTKVTARHIKILQLPEGAAPPNAFDSLETVEGQVARARIEVGEILIASRFVEHNQGSTLSALVAENMRAVTLRVNDIVGVAGFLLPGNRVDVISIRGGKKGATSEVVLSNVKVLAVDQTTATERNDPVIVRAVTLELSPAKALILVTAEAKGAIQLTLRNPLDTVVAQVVPEVKPVPKKVVTYRPRARSSSTTIQIIRGLKETKEKTKI